MVGLKNYEHFNDVCRKCGIKITPQRQAIYRIIDDSAAHPGAETVFNTVRNEMPNISLDTVYRTLRLFESSGLVRRVGSVMPRDRFDGNTQPHSHFVCERCGEVFDLQPGTPSQSCQIPKEAYQCGEPAEIYCEVRGLCRQCTAHKDNEKNNKKRKEKEQWDRKKSYKCRCSGIRSRKSK